MEIVVNLDADVEELLRNEVRNRNVDFHRAVNDAIRAGIAHKSERLVPKTYSLGRNLDDPKAVLAELDELKDEERLRRMRLAETE